MTADFKELVKLSEARKESGKEEIKVSEEVAWNQILNLSLEYGITDLDSYEPQKDDVLQVEGMKVLARAVLEDLALFVMKGVLSIEEGEDGLLITHKLIHPIVVDQGDNIETMVYQPFTSKVRIAVEKNHGKTKTEIHQSMAGAMLKEHKFIPPLYHIKDQSVVDVLYSYFFVYR